MKHFVGVAEIWYVYNFCSNIKHVITLWTTQPFLIFKLGVCLPSEATRSGGDSSSVELGGWAPLIKDLHPNPLLFCNWPSLVLATTRWPETVTAMHYTCSARGWSWSRDPTSSTTSLIMLSGTFIWSQFCLGLNNLVLVLSWSQA